MHIVILSIGLDPKFGGGQNVLLVSFYLKCNMWFSSTGQLLHNSLDFCSLLQNPVSLNGLPSHSAEGQTGNRAIQVVTRFKIFFNGEIPPFTVHKFMVTEDLGFFA